MNVTSERGGGCCENYFFFNAKIWRKRKETTHVQVFVVARTFEDILLVLEQERYIPLLRGTVCDLIEMCCQHNALRLHTASTFLGCKIINTVFAPRNLRPFFLFWPLKNRGA